MTHVGEIMGRKVLADAVREAIKKNGLKKCPESLLAANIPADTLRWKVEEAVSHCPAGGSVVLEKALLEPLVGVDRIRG